MVKQANKMKSMMWAVAAVKTCECSKKQSQLQNHPFRSNLKLVYSSLSFTMLNLTNFKQNDVINNIMNCLLVFINGIGVYLRKLIDKLVDIIVNKFFVYKFRNNKLVY